MMRTLVTTYHLAQLDLDLLVMMMNLQLKGAVFPNPAPTTLTDLRNVSTVS